MPSRLPLRLVAVLVLLVAIPDAEAGRRGLRVDAGAWNAPQEISLGSGSGACPEAGWDAQVSIPIPKPLPEIFWGWVIWNNLEFRTSAFEGLSIFTCQTSKPYTPGAAPDEYLNVAIFPDDEADLGAMIGGNYDNAVTAIRYSWLGEFNGGYYGRQWTFYFFSDGTTIVALHGVEDGQPTYEWIYDHDHDEYVWRAEDSDWNGEYFCFQGFYYGDCVPPRPEYIFQNSFE